jgi:hypothetical protein
MEAKSLGQIGYEAYGDHQYWLSVDGRAMPAWASVRVDIQQAWQAAARAIMRQVHTAQSEVAQQERDL